MVEDMLVDVKLMVAFQLRLPEVGRNERRLTWCRQPSPLLFRVPDLSVAYHLMLNGNPEITESTRFIVLKREREKSAERDQETRDG